MSTSRKSGAPWASTVLVTGQPAFGLRGNCGADFNLSQADLAGYSLRVAGIQGEIDGRWRLGGAAAVITAAETADTWTLDADASVTHLVVRGRMAGTISAEYYTTVYAVGDLSADIVATGSDAYGISLWVLIAGSAGGASLDVPGGICVVNVADWTGGPGSSFRAAWLTQLVARGGARPGDWGVDLTLTGWNSAGVSLAAATVLGEIDGRWGLAGGAGSIYAGSTAAEWTLDADAHVTQLVAGGRLAGTISAEYYTTVYAAGDLSADIVATGSDAWGVSIWALTAGSARGASLDVPGGIHAVNVVDWSGGEGNALHAAWLTQLVVRGHGARPGNFGADVTLTGWNSAGVSVSAATILGELDGRWDLAGGVGSIYAANTAETWTLHTPGNVAGLWIAGRLAGRVSAATFGRIYALAEVSAEIAATGADSRGVSIASLIAGSAADASVTAEGGIELVWLDTTETIHAAWVGRRISRG